MIVAETSSEDSRFAAKYRTANDAAQSTRPKISALRVATACRASGRRSVRFIFLSMSASTTMLRVFALPAPSHPPIKVKAMTAMST